MCSTQVPSQDRAGLIALQPLVLSASAGGPRGYLAIVQVTAGTPCHQ